jgi:cob(I)alamin adenosyltransferase
VISHKEKPTLQTDRESFLDKYSIDLIAKAKEGKIDPVIGRESEIKRVSKNSLTTRVIGSVDELNASLGVLDVWNHDDMIEYQEQLQDIQSDLFRLGSNLSTNNTNEKFYFIQEDVDKLELWINKMDSNLPTLKNFIYPRSLIQVSRAMCRKTERKIVKLNDIDSMEPLIFQCKYMNRLSDYLFTLDRYVNIHFYGGDDHTFISKRNV